VTQEPILRVAALYHGVFGAVFLLFPVDAARALRIEPGTTWLPWLLAAAASLGLGVLLEWSRRAPTLRPGVLAAGIVANLTSAALIGTLTVWDGLPITLLGAALAGVLWAWLFWGLLTPPGASP
jgi:hypothetical protein